MENKNHVFCQRERNCEFHTRNAAQAVYISDAAQVAGGICNTSLKGSN